MFNNIQLYLLWYAPNYLMHVFYQSGIGCEFIGEVHRVLFQCQDPWPSSVLFHENSLEKQAGVTPANKASRYLSMVKTGSMVAHGDMGKRSRI